MKEYGNEYVNVRIPDDVYHSMIEESARSWPKETGGILIGLYDEKLRSATVKAASRPPDDSQHFRFKFLRGLRGMQARLKKANKVGNYYLGEWHSHPGGSSHPSLADIEQMKKISKSSEYHCPEPIMAIVGGDRRTPEMSITLVMRGEVYSLDGLS